MCIVDMIPIEILAHVLRYIPFSYSLLFYYFQCQFAPRALLQALLFTCTILINCL